MRLKKTSATLAGLGLALSLAACGGGSGGGSDAVSEVDEDVSFEAGTTMAELNEAGTITIGTKFDQPLFGLRSPSGEPEGFDVEIGKLIAAKLGIEAGDIDWVETVSENRETYIEDGRVDLVIATYTINDDRKELIDFAGPYFNAGQMILVPEDSDIESIDQLEAEGGSVCTARGSTPEANIDENYPEVVIQAAAAYADCLEPLRNGQVDALTTDNVILSGYIDQNPGEFKLVGETFTEEPYGVGLMKGDDDFRAFINDVIEESYGNGEWDEAWERTAGTVLEQPTSYPIVDRY